MDTYKGISREKLEDLLDRISKVKILLIGDICLDVYWEADMTRSELSRETPHFPLPVVEERMYPGAGGNAAANIAALLPESVTVLGVVGKDWRGGILVKKLQEAGACTDGIVTSSSAVTNAYCKPVRKGISHIHSEDPRLDFNNYENLPEKDETKLLELLEQVAGTADVLCVSDQLNYGCITPAVREKIIGFAKQGKRVIVDSRDRISLYTDVILKPNEVEGARAVYGEDKTGRLSLEEYAEAASALSGKSNSKICMTLGPKGCIFADSQFLVHIPSYDVVSPIDICGAGDTFLAAFACALAAGAQPWEAASFANMAADVTIQKIGITGTASAAEIRSRHREIFG